MRYTPEQVTQAFRNIALSEITGGVASPAFIEFNEDIAASPVAVATARIMSIAILGSSVEGGPKGGFIAAGKLLGFALRVGVELAKIGGAPSAEPEVLESPFVTA